MRTQTTLLRVLLVLLLIVLVAGCGTLYLISLEAARMFPEYAHLRLPVFVGVVVGLIPVPLAVILLFDFCTLVDRGEAFSDSTVQVFRRIRVLVGIVAGYFAVGLVAFHAAFGRGQLGVLFAWVVLEVAALFMLTAVAVLERLFRAAHVLRQDTELTV